MLQLAQVCVGVSAEVECEWMRITMLERLTYLRLEWYSTLMLMILPCRCFSMCFSCVMFAAVDEVFEWLGSEAEVFASGSNSNSWREITLHFR